MTIGTILEHLQGLAPLELAQSWDNVGLLIGDPNRRVHKVLISLDATSNAADYAISEGYDLILSHHPLIFRPLKSITNPLLLKMIEARLSLISLHTNFDAALGGVNHALAEALELEIIDALGDSSEGAIGLICALKQPLNLQELATHVKNQLHAPSVKLWSAGKPLTETIHRIAICGGAGGSVLGFAEAKADVLISGDISYHSFLESRIPIIDAGHFYTEYPALETLQNALSSIGVASTILPLDLHEWQQNMSFH